MTGEKPRFYLILTICLVLIVNTLRSLGGVFSGGERLKMAKEELFELEGENRRLLVQKKWVESSDFVEEQARNRLGLVKPGEMVFVLPESIYEGENHGQWFAPEVNWREWLNLLVN